MKKIIKLLLIILGMLVIFNFSNQVKTDSDKLTVKVIKYSIKISNGVFHKDLTEQQAKKIIKKVFVPIRKCAHFSVYFILALLIMSYLKEFNISYQESVLIALLICMAYACTDEIHQLFVAGRSANIRDVFIDTLGAELSLFIYTFIHKERNKEI